MIEQAIKLAVSAHEGQVDKSGFPYIFHPLTVMLNLHKGGFNEVAQCVGVLHDIVEDTEVTLLDIADSFGKDIASGVSLLTRWHDETYNEYIERCIKSPLGSLIKYYDSMHNLERKENLGQKDLDFVEGRYGGTVLKIRKMFIDNPCIWDEYIREK